MSSAERELEEALVEVGGRLRSPPDSDEALLELLDKAETHLARVDQSPSPSILAALGPAKEALVAKNLMGHSNMEVKVAVASCVSEITRITAPEAPYDDDRMKVIFQMIVEAFGKLDDLSSRSFPKRLSILETVAKVRSCVVMLDLECDALILDMFRFFLKTIRPDHPDKVFSSMELIMTLVLEESEDISAELISCLLNSVKMDNKEVLPVGRRLGEKVISKCAMKLKPFLVQAQSLSGSCEYSKVVASIISDALEQNETDSTGEILGDDSKLSERTVSDDLPEGSMKTAEESGSPEKVDIADKSLIMNNGTIQSGDGGFTVEPTSSNRKPETSGRSSESKDVSRDGADSDDLESTDIKSDSFLDRKPKKMKGRKPNSSVQVMDTREDSRNDSDEVPSVPRNIEVRKETGNSQVEAQRVKEAESTVSLEPEDNDDLQPTRRSDNGSAALSSPTPSEDVTDKKKSKRRRPYVSKGSSKRNIKDTVAGPPASTSEEKGSVLDDQNQDELPSEGINVKKEPEATGKKRRSETAHEVEKTSLSSDPEAKSAPKTGKRSLKRKVKGGSSRKKQKSNVKQTEGIFSLEKDAVGESSSKISGTHDNPDQNLKLDESFVGSKIQVWWPDDAMFYAGRVDSFDPSNGMHKIVYEDDEIEILLLKNERFELIGDGGEMEGDQPKDFPSPPEVKQSNKKTKANSGGSVSKQGKKQTPLQSDEHDSGLVKSPSSKPKGRPSKKSKEMSASKSKDEIPKITGHDSSDERDSEVVKSPATRPRGRSLKKRKETPASKSKDETPKTTDPDFSDDTDGGDVKDTFVKPRGRPRKKLKETPASKSETPASKSEDEIPKIKSGRKLKDDSLTIDSKAKEDSPKTSSKLMDVDTRQAAGKAKDDSVKAKSSQTTPKSSHKKKLKVDVTPQAIEESPVEGTSSEKGKGADRATHSKSHETETPTKTQASQGSSGNARKRKAFLVPRK